MQSSSQSVNLGGAPPALTTTDVQTDMQLATSAPVVRMVRAKLGSAPPVAASEVAQTNVIALTAVSASPARAALIANTYARNSSRTPRASPSPPRPRPRLSYIRRSCNWPGRSESLQGNPNNAAQVSALANQEAVLKEESAQLRWPGQPPQAGSNS